MKLLEQLPDQGGVRVYRGVITKARREALETREEVVDDHPQVAADRAGGVEELRGKGEVSVLNVLLEVRHFASPFITSADLDQSLGGSRLL